MAPVIAVFLLDAATTGGRATELRGARGRPRGPAESCRRVVLLPAPLAGHQTRLAGAEGARRCLCAYTRFMQAALPPRRQWRWSAPFHHRWGGPGRAGWVGWAGGLHQRQCLRRAMMTDAPSVGSPQRTLRQGHVYRGDPRRAPEPDHRAPLARTGVGMFAGTGERGERRRLGGRGARNLGAPDQR